MSESLCKLDGKVNQAQPEASGEVEGAQSQAVCQGGPRVREALPKLDREAFQASMQADIQEMLQGVVDAVDNARAGRVIRDIEEPVRDILDKFRQTVYERAVQAKVDAAEAAFPLRRARRRARPSGTRGVRSIAW